VQTLPDIADLEAAVELVETARAADGTTPASRFFRRSFPDLFERVVSQIDALPMPKQRRQALAASH